MRSPRELRQILENLAPGQQLAPSLRTEVASACWQAGKNPGELLGAEAWGRVPLEQQQHICKILLAAGPKEPGYEILQEAAAEPSYGAMSFRSTPSQPPHSRGFPTGRLPDPLDFYVRSAARAIGCDDAMIALPVLAMLAACIGTTRCLRIRRAWDELPILWVAVVAAPGTKKTPAVRLALKSLRAVQNRALEEHQGLAREHEIAAELYKASFGDWKRSGRTGAPPERPAEPRARRYIASDVTTEALGPLLVDNPRGLLVACDELSGWLDFDRYSGGAGGGDAARWLSCWSGEPMTVDRIGRGLVHVPRAAVSLVGGIQPEPLARSLGRKHRENGLLARLLLAMPRDTPGRWTDDDVSEETEALLARVVSGLLALDHTHDPDGNLAPVPVPFTPAARAVFVEWWEANAKSIASESGDLRASLAKLPAYVARLALIFELTAAAATEVHVAAVDLPSVQGAIAVVDWFRGEAARVVEMLDETAEGREERTVAEWIDRRGRSATIAELARSGPRIYRGKLEAAEEVLDRLVRSGRARWEDTTGAGRPTRLVRLLAAGTET